MIERIIAIRSRHKNDAGNSRYHVDCFLIGKCSTLQLRSKDCKKNCKKRKLVLPRNRYISKGKSSKSKTRSERVFYKSLHYY